MFIDARQQVLDWVTTALDRDAIPLSGSKRKAIYENLKRQYYPGVSYTDVAQTFTLTSRCIRMLKKVEYVAVEEGAIYHSLTNTGRRAVYSKKKTTNDLGKSVTETRIFLQLKGKKAKLGEGEFSHGRLTLGMRSLCDLGPFPASRVWGRDSRRRTLRSRSSDRC